MKTLILLLVLFPTLSFAHTCQVSVRTERGSPQVMINTEKDHNCARAVQRCLEILREDRYPSAYGCYIDKKVEDPSPSPTPTPTPRPTPTPTPAPAPQVEGPVKHRPVQVGERVIFNGVSWTVTGVPDVGLLDVKSVTGNRIIRDVARWYVAITEGCYLQLCSGKRAIELRSKKLVIIEGIEWTGSFIYKDIQSGRLTFSTPFTDLAQTEGCNSTVCVGNRVVSADNIYSKVVALQPDGKVILEKEGTAHLVFGVDPATLTIVR